MTTPKRPDTGGGNGPTVDRDTISRMTWQPGDIEIVMPIRTATNTAPAGPSSHERQRTTHVSLARVIRARRDPS